MITPNVHAEGTNICIQGGKEEEKYNFKVYKVVSGINYETNITFEISTTAENNSAEITLPPAGYPTDEEYKIVLEAFDDGERFYMPERFESNVIASTRYDSSGDLVVHQSAKGAVDAYVLEHFFAVAFVVNPIGNMLDPNATYQIRINNVERTISKTSPVVLNNLTYEDVIEIEPMGLYSLDKKTYNVSELKKVVDYDGTTNPEAKDYNMLEITYDISPVTGLTLNAIPFIILLTISAVGVFAFRKQKI